MLLKFTVLILIAGIWSEHDGHHHHRRHLHKSPSQKVAESWNAFKAIYGKTYKTVTHEKNARTTFVRNCVRMDKRYSNETNGLLHPSILSKVNSMTDLTQAEYGKLLGFEKDMALNSTFWVPPANLTLPVRIDYREYNFVTPVMDQLKCQSCWAFSAVGAIEAQYARLSKQLTVLSKTELMACSIGKEYLNACYRGSMERAFDFLQGTQGLCSEEEYPYTSFIGPCRSNEMRPLAKVVGYRTILPSEEMIMFALLQEGPISVAIYSNTTEFKELTSETYKGRECTNTDKADHAVLLVGYDENETGKYWILKNSHGTGWGDKGYFRMARTGKNLCALWNHASFPIVSIANKPY